MFLRPAKYEQEITNTGETSPAYGSTLSRYPTAVTTTEVIAMKTSSLPNVPPHYPAPPGRRQLALLHSAISRQFPILAKP